MGRPKKGTPRIIPSCHPERRHQAKGLCVACYRKQWVAEHRKTDPMFDSYATRGWNGHLKRYYGITAEDYRVIFATQGGRCALCKRIPRGQRIKMPVDHDHVSGSVRGILCHSCNWKLGWYEKRRKAIDAYMATSSCWIPSRDGDGMEGQDEPQGGS